MHDDSTTACIQLLEAFRSNSCIRTFHSHSALSFHSRARRVRTRGARVRRDAYSGMQER